MTDPARSKSQPLGPQVTEPTGASGKPEGRTIKQRLEDHIVVIVLSTAVTSFVAGWGAHMAVVKEAGSESPAITAPQATPTHPDAKRHVAEILDSAWARGQSWLDPGTAPPPGWQVEGWIKGTIDAVSPFRDVLPGGFFASMQRWANSAVSSGESERPALIRAVTEYLDQVKRGL